MTVEIVQETPESRAQAIAQLKSVLSTDPSFSHTFNLVLSRPDCDAFLLRFVRARKFNIKRAAELIKNFAAWTAEYKLTNPNLTPRMESILPAAAALQVYENPGPAYRDHEGRQVLFMRMGRGQPWNFSPEQMLPVWFNVMESVLQYEHTQIYGICIVGIPEGVEMKHFDRKLVQLVTAGVQKRMPLRMGRMLMCRPPAFFRIVFPIVRAFISEKMAKRFVLCPDPAKQLPQYMPQECVPPEYRGSHALKPLAAGEGMSAEGMMMPGEGFVDVLEL